MENLIVDEIDNYKVLAVVDNSRILSSQDVSIFKLIIWGLVYDIKLEKE